MNNDPIPGSRGSFVPAGLFALLLWVLASLPGDDLQRIQATPENPLLAFILSDPFMHFLTFGLLALLIRLGLYGRARDTVPFATATVLASGYGLLIEVYQAILPWRSFGLDDVAWNTMGVVVFLGVLRWKLGRSGTGCAG
ncbi:MAG: VanZ family protein [Anaerolineae bacterium]